MSKRTHNRIRSALGGLLLCLMAGLVTSDEKQPSVHVVVPGESLWLLADQYLGTPYRWRDLWQLNPQIREPRLIYPGDVIQLPHAVEQAPAIQTDRPTRPVATAETASPTAAAQQTPATVVRRLGKRATAEPRQQRSGNAAQQAITAKGKTDTRTAQSTPAASAPNGGFRSLTVPAKPAVEPKVGYVDRLIDPDAPEDSFADFTARTRSRGALAAIDHSLELLTLYRDDDINFNSSFDYGVQYSARTSTRNWGDLNLNLIALDEFGDLRVNQGQNNGLFEPQSGIARLTLEQTNLPLTEQLTLDNTFGMHRQRRYNPFRERANLINYRFSAAEPDIQGVSSQLKYRTSGIGLSVGELGQARGTLLPGFVETEGRIARGQFTHVRDRQAISADIWETEGQTRIDNRRGWRLAYDQILGANTVLSMSGVGSGDQHAVLLGGTTEANLTKHDYGAYYFEPDIVWLDNRIGDNNAGAFYRMNTQQGPRSLGASIEFRRDGLEGDTVFGADTAFVNLSLSQRLSRKSAFSNVYSYRQVDVRSGSQRSYQEHSLRSYITLSHRSDSRSNFGVLTRLRSEERELEFTYGWSKNLHDGSSFELASRFRRQFADTDEADEMALNANWQKQFSLGTSLGLGLGYTLGDSRLASSSGVTGFLSLDHPLTARLGLSLQLDYSVDRADYENANLDDTLFTDNALRNTTVDGLRTFSALLKLSYQLNGRSQPTILRGTGFAQGAGRVQGFVYVDANGDGERQPDERGVAGITLFLNSIHPVVTDARGAYSFPSVSPGQHFLFVDEATLPLPWTLINGEYSGLEVHLRRTTQVDIPLSTIALAEAQQ